MNLDQSGQHYMIDKKLIKYIVDEAMLSPTDVVLEIGCGHGELTYEVAKKCKVIAVDVEDHKIRGKNILYVKGNILKIFLDVFNKYKFNKIIANIPYNISEPLMRLLFKVDVELVLLTVGESFSEILTSKDNRIGIIANELYDIEILKQIPSTSFKPMPRIVSALVSMEQRDIDDVPKVSAIYKGLVLLEEKKLKNCFEKILGKAMTKRKIRELTKDDIFEKRLYQLSNKEFMRLDELLKRFD